MNSSVEYINPFYIKITLQIPFSTIRDALNLALKKEKLPLIIDLENLSVDQKLVYVKVKNKIALSQLYACITENNLKVVGEKRASFGTLDSKNGLTVDVYCSIFQELQSLNYSNLRLDLPSLDQRVDNKLSELLEAHAQLVEIKDDSAFLDGDILDLEYQIVETSTNNPKHRIQYRLGSNVFPSDIQKQLQVMKFKQHLSIDGNGIYYNFYLHGTARKVVPDLNDHFVQSLNLGLQSVQDFKSAVRIQLEKDGSSLTKDVKEELFSQLIEDNPFDLSEALVEERIKQILRIELGHEPEEADLFHARARYWQIAERATRIELIIDYVLEKEELYASLQFDNIDSDDIETSLRELERLKEEVFLQFLLKQSIEH